MGSRWPVATGVIPDLTKKEKIKNLVSCTTFKLYPGPRRSELFDPGLRCLYYKFVSRTIVKNPDRESKREDVAGLWDVGNPESIYRLLDDKVAEIFLNAKMQSPHLFEKDEDDLRRTLKDITGRFPTTIENQVRLKFWLEYDNATFDGGARKLDITCICRGVCTTDTFFAYLHHVTTVAWIACMPMGYESHLMEILNYGAYRTREIMGVSAYNKETGKIDTKLAELQWKMYMASEMRIYGSIPQITKNVNLNFDHNKDARKGIEAEGTRLLEEKIVELEKLELKKVKQIARDPIKV